MQEAVALAYKIQTMLHTQAIVLSTLEDARDETKKLLHLIEEKIRTLERSSGSSIFD